MWIVAVVDVSAEARLSLASTINRSLADPALDSHLLPLMSVVPLAVEELKFHSNPHVIVVGAELVEQEITLISQLRAQVPDARLLVIVPANRNRIASIEHLIRLGADDVIDASVVERDLVTRLVLLGRKVKQPEGGKLLIVDGVKGGVGTTSICSAIGGAAAEQGARVALVDLDVINRSVSRYLRVRPLINENLQQILDGQRGCSAEFVDQALIEIELEKGAIAVLAPGLSQEIDAGEARAGWIRNYLAVIELLDQKFDLVIVDLARCQGLLRESLLRAADHMLLVGTPDPVCLPALAESLRQLRAVAAPDAPIAVVRNERERDGLSARVWFDEVRRIGESVSVQLEPFIVPYGNAAMRWPGSGETFMNAGGGQPIASVSRAMFSWSVGAAVNEHVEASSTIDKVRATAFNFLKVLSLRRGDMVLGEGQLDASSSEARLKELEANRALPPARLGLPEHTVPLQKEAVSIKVNKPVAAVAAPSRAPVQPTVNAVIEKREHKELEFIVSTPRIVSKSKSPASAGNDGKLPRAVARG